MPQSEWPTVKREKTGDFVTPDGYLRSGRNVSGPLRMGTAPGTGPSGLVAGGGASDFGMDRVSPRGYDPIGASLERASRQESSPLLSRAIRGRGKEDK